MLFTTYAFLAIKIPWMLCTRLRTKHYRNPRKVTPTISLNDSSSRESTALSMLFPFTSIATIRPFRSSRARSTSWPVRVDAQPRCFSIPFITNVSILSSPPPKFPRPQPIPRNIPLVQPAQLLLDHGQEPISIGGGEFVCGETADVIDRLLGNHRLSHDRLYLHRRAFASILTIWIECRGRRLTPAGPSARRCAERAAGHLPTSGEEKALQI